MRKRWRWTAAGMLALAGLLYLRDPAWLINFDSGLYGWEHNRAGQRFRWMGARASFFVPSDAKAVSIPLHALFITDDRRPFVVRVDVNDRPAMQVVLADEQWAPAELRVVVPKNWSRKVVRIDLHASRTWSDRAISVQVGEVAITK